MEKRKEYRIELSIILFLFVLINVLSHTLQHPISFNNGQGFDGVEYFKVAEQLANHRLPNANAPFVYRIGTPLIVSLFFGSDLLLGFKIINIAGNLLASVLFVFWLRLYLNDWKTRVLLETLFLVMWLGPVRFVYYYPAYVDPWLFVSLLAGLIGIQKTQANATVVRICLLGLVVFLGVIFREVVLVIPFAFLFSKNFLNLSGGISYALANLQVKQIRKSIPLTFFLPLGFGIIGLLIIKLTVTQNNAYSFFRAAAEMTYQKTFSKYLHAWFITFGPIIFIPIYYWRSVFSFLAKNQFMLIYLIGFSILAWIGGYDTERFLFWGSPVVYLIIGRLIEDNAISAKLFSLELTILFVLQLISERVFWTIPDYPNEFSTPFPILTILSNNFQYFDLYSLHGDMKIQAFSFFEYILIIVLLLLWFNYRTNKLVK